MTRKNGEQRENKTVLSDIMVHFYWTLPQFSISSLKLHLIFSLFLCVLILKSSALRSSLLSFAFPCIKYIKLRNKYSMQIANNCVLARDYTRILSIQPYLLCQILTFQVFIKSFYNNVQFQILHMLT